MMSQKFRTHYSGTFYQRGLCEQGPWKSETIPDQTMTVREMLQRHAAGLSVGDRRVPLYESDDPELAALVPLDWEKWDLSEKEDFVNDLSVRVRKAKSDALLKANADRTEKLRAEERDKLLKEMKPPVEVSKPPVP